MKNINKAVALEYDGKVPRIRATAVGFLAERLLDIAREHNITIYRDPDLAEVLSRFEAGTEIPEGLYRAAAEVLAFCYRTNNDVK